MERIRIAMVGWGGHNNLDISHLSRAAHTDLIFYPIVQVGSSALTLQYLHQNFVTDYAPTIIDEYRKNVEIDGQQRDVTILDGYGDEIISRWRENFIRGCHGLFVVYSVTDTQSFDALEESVEEAFRVGPHLRNSKRVILVGNKIDLERERTVTRAMGEMKAQSHGWMFDETSALLYLNVVESFSRVISACIEELQDQPAKPARRAGCSLQ